MFTLAISCLTTANLPWFMDLTFQVPMLYCSLQHWTLLPSPVTSITVCCFCFDSISSFFVELFLHWSPVVFWTPSNLESSSLSVLAIFFPFHTVLMGEGFLCSSVSKVSACNAGGLGLIPRSGRSPGEGNGNPLQYSCLENPTEEPGGLQFMELQELARI